MQCCGGWWGANTDLPVGVGGGVGVRPPITHRVLGITVQPLDTPNTGEEVKVPSGFRADFAHWSLPQAFSHASLPRREDEAEIKDLRARVKELEAELHQRLSPVAD